MPSAPSKVQVSTHSTGSNEKHQDCSCRNDNYPLQLGGDFSTFPAGNVSLKSRPNNQLKKNQLSQCPQVLIGEKHHISSCIKEELCKAHVWSLVFQGQLQKSILESHLCLLLPGCCGARHPPMGTYGLIPKGSLCCTSPTLCARQGREVSVPWGTSREDLWPKVMFPQT